MAAVHYIHSNTGATLCELLWHCAEACVSNAERHPRSSRRGCADIIRALLRRGRVRLAARAHVPSHVWPAVRERVGPGQLGRQDAGGGCRSAWSERSERGTPLQAFGPLRTSTLSLWDCARTAPCPERRPQPRRLPQLRVVRLARAGVNPPDCLALGAPNTTPSLCIPDWTDPARWTSLTWAVALICPPSGLPRAG